MSKIKKYLLYPLLFLCLISNLLLATILVTVNITPAGAYDVTMNLYNADDDTWQAYDNFSTNASGVALRDLGPFNYDYKFSVEVNGYAVAYANNKTSLGAANAFNLTNPSETNIYFTLNAAHSIAGNIKNRSSQNLSNIKVLLFDSGNNWVSTVTTNAAGNFLISGIGNGNYFIKAEDDSNTYFNQWYNGAYGYSDRTTVNVNNANVTGINFSLYNAGTITGRVTDNATAGNLQNVVVAAFVKGSAFTWINQVTTNATGQYSIKVPAVSVNIMLRASTTNYQDMFYLQELYDWRNSVTLNVPSGTTVANKNFSMYRTYTLSGTVTNNHTAGTLSGVAINIYNSSGTWLKSTTTDTGGAYSVSLINGTYYVQAQNTGYFTQYYKNAWGNGDRTAVVVSSANKPNINFSLHRTATITGAIINGDAGGNLNNVGVTAFVRNSSFIYVAQVTANGTYSLTVPAGVALMLKTSTSNYDDVFYNQAVSWPVSTTVNVSPLGTSANINFTLYKKWPITGTVRNRSSVAINNVKVSVYNSSGVWLKSVSTNASGVYSVSVNNGTYYLKTEDPANGLYFDQFYNNAFGNADRSLVTVSGTTVNSIDFSMYRKATISGTIRDASTAALLNNIAVMAFVRNSSFLYVAQITANGTYSLTVPAGVPLMLRATSANYDTMFYNQVSTWPSSTTLNLADGGTATGINFNMNHVWTIGGTVTDRAANPLNNVRVSLYNGSGTWLRAVSTNASGVFSMPANNGSFYLKAEDLAGNLYFNQFYNNAFGDTDRTSLTVSNANLTGINFSLYRRGTVSGTVRDGDTSGNLNNVMVYAFLRNSSFTYVTKTTANGTYSLAVPAGVPLMIKTLTSNYEDVFYNGVAAWNTSTTVNVAPGGTSSNINFNLYRTWMITGNVQNRSGTALNNIKVNLYNSSGTWLRSVSSNASGYYQVSANNGSFYLKAEDPVGGLYFTQWYTEAYGETDRTIVTVSNANLTGQNFSLYRNAKITGILRDESSSPLNNAVAYVFLKNSSFTWVAQATSNIAGSYSVTVPATVELMVRANRSGYQTTFYNNVLTWGSATTINATAGSTVSGININLNRWWRIGGHVYTSDGSSASGATVVYQVSGNSPVTVSVAADGSYDHQSTQNTTYPVLITYSKTDYITVTRSVTVVIGVTDITTYNVTLNAQETPLPDWYSNIEDSIKSGPNPANPDDGPVHIGFVVEDTATAKLLIYTMGGEIVFSDSKRVDRGYHEFLWEGDDRYNENVANGLYLGYMEIKTGGKTYKKVLKIAILR